MVSLQAHDGSFVVIQKEHMDGAQLPAGTICEHAATLNTVRDHLVDGTFDTGILSLTQTQMMFDLLNAGIALQLTSILEPIAQFIANHVKDLPKAEAAAFLGTDSAAAATDAEDRDPCEREWLQALQ